MGYGRNATEQRTCKNPLHPFKQKWYNYNEKFDDPDYCSTCAHNFKIMKHILSVILQPSATLYGDKEISLSREQAIALVNQIYDEGLNNGDA